MVADLVQMKRALRKADSVGDTQAAQRLAMAIKAEEQRMTHQPRAPRPEQEVPTWEGALRSGFQGATFGFGDEIVAGGAAALHPLVSPEDGSTFGQRYDRYLGRERDKMGNFSESNPAVAIPAEIAGAIPPALFGLGAAGGASALGTAARGAAIGGGEAGLYGFGQGEGGAGDRAMSAASAATVGGPVGAVAPFAGEGIRRVGEALAAPVRGALGGVNQPRAARYLGRNIQRSGRSVDELQDDLTRAAAEGQSEYILADALGRRGQKMLSGVTRQPSDIQNEIVDFLSQRQANQGDRVGGFIRDEFGFGGASRSPGTEVVPQGYQFRDTPEDVLSRPQRSARDTGERLTTARREVADEAYESARAGAGPVDVRGALGVIDQRIGGMKGSNITGDGIDAKLSRFRSRLAADPAPDGEISRELSDFDRVLWVKRDVQDASDEAFRAGRGNEGAELKKLARELDGALENASDGYRAANDEFARTSRVIDAVDEGADMARTGVRAVDNAARAGGMAPTQREAARIGYGDRLLGNVERAAEGADKSRPLTSTKVRGDIDTFASDPARLRRQVDRERTMFDTRNAATGGSQTADNVAEISEAAGPNVIGLAADASTTGGMASLIGNAARAGGRALTGTNDETLAEIGRALLSRNPAKALQPALEQAMKDKATARVLEALLRGGTIRAQ